MASSGIPATTPNETTPVDEVTTASGGGVDEFSLVSDKAILATTMKQVWRDFRRRGRKYRKADKKWRWTVNYIQGLEQNMQNCQTKIELEQTCLAEEVREEVKRIWYKPLSNQTQTMKERYLRYDHTTQETKTVEIQFEAPLPELENDYYDFDSRLSEACGRFHGPIPDCIHNLVIDGEQMIDMKRQVPLRQAALGNEFMVWLQSLEDVKSAMCSQVLPVFGQVLSCVLIICAVLLSVLPVPSKYVMIIMLLAYVLMALCE